MHQFEFHYQYQPEDLKAIREANSEPIFSPASYITAASIGFALSLVILGAMGAWIVLGFALITGFVGVTYFAKRLNSQSRGNREYQIRQLLFFDKYVAEITEHCESRKSWDVFEELIETKQHFLLRHYQRVIAIPKRAIPQPEIDPCREFMRVRIGTNNCGPVDVFEDWFGRTNEIVYRYTWENQDADSIRAGQLTRYGTNSAKQKTDSDSAGSDSVVGYISIVLAVGLIAAIYFQFGPPNFSIGWNRWTQIVVSSLTSIFALSLPLVAIWWWKRYMKILMQNQKIRMPVEEIGIFQTADFVCVGYAGAVSKYGMAGITALYLGSRLLGFRIGSGPVNVIPVRAFGDRDKATEFLDRMNANSARVAHQNLPPIPAIETGNPYQPPGY